MLRFKLQGLIFMCTQQKFIPLWVFLHIYRSKIQQSDYELNYTTDWSTEYFNFLPYATGTLNSKVLSSFCMNKLMLPFQKTHVKQRYCGCLILEDKKAGFQLAYDGLWRNWLYFLSHLEMWTELAGPRCMHCSFLCSLWAKWKLQGRTTVVKLQNSDDIT